MKQSANIISNKHQKMALSMSKRLIWTKAAWSDYKYWCNHQKETHHRVNELVKDILKVSVDGLGQPEKLIGSLNGLWTRKIDVSNRLIYAVSKDCLTIISCRHHLKPRIAL